MCLGIPGQVVELVDPANHLAKVDVNGIKRTISVRLLADDGLQAGDWVLVHVGFAMARIDQDEAVLSREQFVDFAEPGTAFVLRHVVELDQNEFRFRQSRAKFQRGELQKHFGKQSRRHCRT